MNNFTTEQLASSRDWLRAELNELEATILSLQDKHGRLLMRLCKIKAELTKRTLKEIEK